MSAEERHAENGFFFLFFAGGRGVPAGKPDGRGRPEEEQISSGLGRPESGGDHLRVLRVLRVEMQLKLVWGRTRSLDARID